MPATIELKHSYLTLEVSIDEYLKLGITDYLIEIQYEKDSFNPNHATKIWIHDNKTGRTILRIQEKP